MLMSIPLKICHMACIVNASPCYVNASPCYVNASACIVNASPCYVNASACIVNASPCYVNASPCYVNASPCIVNASPCYVNASACIRHRPNLIMRCLKPLIRRSSATSLHSFLLLCLLLMHRLALLMHYIVVIYC
jgi:hypothetical protein